MCYAILAPAGGGEALGLVGLNAKTFAFLAGAAAVGIVLSVPVSALVGKITGAVAA